MTLMITPKPEWKTTRLLAEVLRECVEDKRVQFLVDAGSGSLVVQRLRVALSRSRNRHRNAGRKVVEFTLCHSIYPHTDSEGKRHDCIVMWIKRDQIHERRELLDDLMERGPNVPQ